MRCQLLNVPPLSGEFPEVLFRARGTCTWVKFSPEESDPWVGVFGWGDFRSEAVAVLQLRPFAFVIAGGVPYIINYEDRVLIWHGHDEWLTGVVAAEEHSIFVACDEIRLRGYSPDGNLLWESRRVSWDGIRNLSIAGESVHGEAEHLDGSIASFSAEIATGVAVGGSYNGPDSPLP